MLKIPRPLPHPMVRRKKYFMGGMTPTPGGLPSPMPAVQPPGPRPLPQPRPAPAFPAPRPGAPAFSPASGAASPFDVLTGTKGMSPGTGTPVSDGRGPWTQFLFDKFNGNVPAARAFKRNYLAGNNGQNRRVPPTGQPPIATFRKGGVTKKPYVSGVGTSYAGGGTAKIVPGAPKLPAPDVIPAALKPDEVILNEKQKKAVAPIPGREHMLLPEQLQALKKFKRPKLQGGGVMTPSVPNAQGVAKPQTDEDFDKIPIGGKFIDPQDGKLYIKHSERKHNTGKMFQYPFA